MGTAAWQSAAIALAIGLLIGSERERHSANARVAGVRTFALAGLAGAIGSLIDPLVLAAIVLAGAGLTAAAYSRMANRDPGATSEIALVLTVLIGGLAVPMPALAAAAGIATAVVLVAKDEIHRFVRNKISETELVDALKFFVVAFIVLPLMPSARLGPYGVINPRTIWLLVVAVTAVGWLGYLAVRMLGPRRGLPAAGLAGGFVSGAATTGAMARIARDPALYRSAMAGALLASVATLIQLVLVTAVADRHVASLLLPAAAMGAVVLVAEAGWLVLRPTRGAAGADETGAGGADGAGAARADEAGAARAWAGPGAGAGAGAVAGSYGADGHDGHDADDDPEPHAVATEPGPADEPAPDDPETAAVNGRRAPPGLAGRRPFELIPALLLAAILTAMLVIAAFAQDVLGAAGSVIAIATAGLADAHAGALTAATLAAQGSLTPSLAVLAAMAAVGVNTVVKLVLAYAAGGQRVCAGLAAYFAAPVAAVAIGLAVTLGLV